MNASRTGVADRISEDLRSRIASGELSPGLLLPGRRALAQRYGAALPTVERAVAALLADGWLRAESRRGTFVADDPPQRRRSRHRFAGKFLGVIATLHRRDEGAENHRLWADTITRGIESVATDEAIGVRFADRWRADGTLVPLGAMLEVFRREGVAAVALVGDTEPVERTVPVLQASGLPFVFAGAGLAASGTHTVQCDGRAAGGMAAAHLLGLGCRRIHFLAPFVAPWIEERIDGARRTVQAAGLPSGAFALHPVRPKSYEIVLGRTDRIYADPGFELALRLLAGPQRPAMLTVNDLTALAVLDAAKQLGKVPGRDFALIGFDDEPRSRFADLSTLRPPLEEMGIETGLLLLRLLDGSACARHVQCQPLLVPRGSTVGFRPDAPPRRPVQPRRAVSAA